MKLSINLVHHGQYIRAGDELPADFQLPEHLEAFVTVTNPPQGSRAISVQHVEGVRGVGGSQLANSAAEESSGRMRPDDSNRYPEGKEEFIPKWRLKRKEREERKKL